MEVERVERTTRNYQKNLMKMNNFRYRPYTEKMTKFRSTPVEIPLKSSTALPDPRLEKTKKNKKKNPEDTTGITPQKMSKKSLENHLKKDLTVSTEIEDVSSQIEDNTIPDTSKDIAKENIEEIACESRELHQENAVHQRTTYMKKIKVDLP